MHHQARFGHEGHVGGGDKPNRVVLDFGVERRRLVEQRPRQIEVAAERLDAFDLNVVGDLRLPRRSAVYLDVAHRPELLIADRRLHDLVVRGRRVNRSARQPSRVRVVERRMAEVEGVNAVIAVPNRRPLYAGVALQREGEV